MADVMTQSVTSPGDVVIALTVIRYANQRDDIADSATRNAPLVEQHFGVVENKKTDGISIKAKLSEWQIISVKYNSQTTHCHRDAGNLKSQWDNMKKAAKKEASHARMRRIQTGGGPPDPKKEDPITSKILSLIKTSAVGLYNPYDNDSVAPATETVTSTGPESEYSSGTSNIDLKKIIETDQSLPVKDIDMGDPTPVDIEVKDCGDYTLVSTPALSHPVSTQSYINVEEDVTMTACETQKQEFVVKDWGDYTPRLLKTPVSAQLKAVNSKSGMSRRRPLHTPAASSLELLHKKKIDAIDLQKILAADEAENKNTLIQLEIEIKKEILKQEYLKTELLLLELRKKRKECEENQYKENPED